MNATVTLQKEDCLQELVPFYRKVAQLAGIPMAMDEDTLFDCRYISVTKQVRTNLIHFYRKVKGLNAGEVGTIMLWYGPKADLEDETETYAARIEDGFIV